MAIAFVREAGGARNQSTTNPTVNFTAPTAGNLIVAILSIANTANNTEVTAPGSGWTERLSRYSTSKVELRISEKISSGAETSVAWTDATARTYDAFVFEFSGVLGAAEYDTNASADSGASAVSSQATGSLTPAGVGELIIGCCALFSTYSTPTADSGFTLLTNGSEIAAIPAYKIKSAADSAAENVTFGWGFASRQATAGIIAIKPAAGASAPDRHLPRGVVRGVTRGVT